MSEYSPLKDPNKQPWVPVVSAANKPLMPCSPKRARELLRKGRAVKRWSKGSIMYLQLLDRSEGNVQFVALGIDPGSKREGYCVLTRNRTLCNIQSHAADGHSIKRKLITRTSMRLSRRSRNTPCRPPRFKNRNRKGWVPPSTKARWQLKFNIALWLSKLYPISHIAIEDVQTKLRKGNRWYNHGFSPIMSGKHWLYTRMEKLYPGNVYYYPGMHTYDERRRLGLYKNPNKLSNDWHTHCVDAYVLARTVLDVQYKHHTQYSVLELVPRKIHRRQLHRLTYQTGNVRSVYGSTRSSGLKKGTTVTHPKWGLCTLGPTGKTGITLLSVEIKPIRLTRLSILEDLVIHSHSPWLLRMATL